MFCMARILGLEEFPHSMRSSLSSNLRVCDEAIGLPMASRSSESGAFKNVVMRLSGSDTDLNPDIFSSNWFAGVSVVPVPAEIAETITRDSERRASALKRLAAKIPSEMANSEIQVGPELDGDESDRDSSNWTAGFDSGSCCVGLYSAHQPRVPKDGADGMNRAHSVYYLVCKAGGGVAAQTFHTRLCDALRSGKTLDQALESGTEPGPQALRRVSLAAQRNRQRILLLAAEALGFHTIDTISDNACSPNSPSRGAITVMDVTYNSLRRVEGTSRSTWQYAAGCADSALSQGMLTSSNLAEGFIAFMSSNYEYRVNVRNEAHNCLPFATPRLATTRELAMKAASAHKAAVSSGRRSAHPDNGFVTEHFSWKSKEFGHAVDIEPSGLWGSHASEAFLARWSRELGVTTCKVIRMQPEVVCIAALEPGKLRAAVKHVQQA